MKMLKKPPDIIMKIKIFRYMSLSDVRISEVRIDKVVIKNTKRVEIVPTEG